MIDLGKLYAAGDIDKGSMVMRKKAFLADSRKEVAVRKKPASAHHADGGQAQAGKGDKTVDEEMESEERCNEDMESEMVEAPGAWLGKVSAN